MDETSQSVRPGGFVRALPSPAPSSSSTTLSTTGLPHPRGRPLIPGTAKEEKVRTYVEGQLLYISRRYIKKFSIQNPDDRISGYKSLAELCKDVEGLVNILWLSATPSLQIPYLLNIANEFPEWLAHFRPSPTATFSLLRKLDHCFASLLLGKDIDTKEPLPGFEEDGNASRGGMSGTDKVRCRSIVEQTRVEIVKAMSGDWQQEEEDDVEEEKNEADDYDTPMETESEAEGSLARSSAYGVEDDDDADLNMDVAKVYENTLVQLGDSI